MVNMQKIKNLDKDDDLLFLKDRNADRIDLFVKLDDCIAKSHVLVQYQPKEMQFSNSFCSAGIKSPRSSKIEELEKQLFVKKNMLVAQINEIQNLNSQKKHLKNKEEYTNLKISLKDVIFDNIVLRLTMDKIQHLIDDLLTRDASPIIEMQPLSSPNHKSMSRISDLTISEFALTNLHTPLPPGINNDESLSQISQSLFNTNLEPSSDPPKTGVRRFTFGSSSQDRK